MSLSVSAYFRDEMSGDLIYIKEKPGSSFNDMFGVEANRWKIWGSRTLKDLGCNVLFTLKNGDIYAEGKELIILEREINLIKEQIGIVSKKLKIGAESLEFQINNALEAIRIAKKYPKGGVSIG